MAKRKVCISYHHAGEQSVVDAFSKKFSDDYEVFADNSVDRAANSDDVDYLARVCREAIVGTSVTIVMIGKQTGCRKFVDWEIDYTLQCKHGLVAISAPGLADQDACLPDRLKDNLPNGSGYAKWYTYPSDASSLKAICSTKRTSRTRQKSRMTAKERNETQPVSRMDIN